MTAPHTEISVFFWNPGILPDFKPDVANNAFQTRGQEVIRVSETEIDNVWVLRPVDNSHPFNLCFCIRKDPGVKRKEYKLMTMSQRKVA